MTYYKDRSQIGAVIRNSLPKGKPPRLTPEQIKNLKTAAEIALKIIATVPVATLAMIVPDIFESIDELFYEKNPNRKPSRSEKTQKVIRTVYYLKEHRFIRMKQSGKDFKVFLTKLGRKKAEKIDFNNLAVSKSRSWDGKWWQVAADIPTEDFKWAADLFRNKLKDMKFFPLQRTLWFYPHDPRKEIEFVLHHYGIESFVTVMEINRLDQDDEKRMKKFFRTERIIE